MNTKTIIAALCVGLLSACASLDRSDQAAAAKSRMYGMSREDVLACMGIPKKKASEGATEVWSYLSTDFHGDSSSDTLKTTSYSHSSGSHDKRFCTVNIVMKSGVVSAVHYNGPTSTNFWSQDDQCGYAVANCLGR